MKSPVFFNTALVVALGQIGMLLPAQAQTAAPLPAAQPAAQVAGQPPVLQAPNILISPKMGSDEEEQSTEPRVMRGTDKLLNIDPSAPVTGGAPVSFRFEEAPVAEVVRTVMGDILKIDYVMHPPLQGTVTLTTPKPIDPDKAVFLLEAALQANGLAMVRDARGTYQVGKPEVLRSLVGNVRIAGAPGSMAPGYGVIVVPLQYIGATEMSNILKPIIPAEALIKVDTVRNVLIMQGTRTQSEGWMEMVKTFDVDLLKGMSVGIYPLKHASIEEVSAALQMVNGGGGQAAQGQGAAASAGIAGGAASAAAQRRPGQATGAAASGSGNNQLSGNAAAAAALLTSLGDSNPLFGALRVLPIPRLNALMVITPRASYLDEAERWIRRLDVPGYGGSEPELYVYRVQNGNAKYLAQVLNGIFGGQQGAAGNMTSGVAPGLNGVNNNNNRLGGGFNNFGGTTGFASGFGNNNANRFGNTGNAQQQGGTPTITATAIGDIRVVADEFNNTILVWSTGSQFRKIEASLKRLDVAPIQVLIEASIIEVTLNDNLEYGVEWLFRNSGIGGRNFSGTGSLGSLNNTTPGTIAAAAGNFTYSLFNSGGDIAARLSAVAGQGQVKMLSSPSVMVMDNHPASISVGEQIPVKVSSTITSTSFLSDNYQLKDTGVILNVTPSVNSGNMVSLQIDQSVIDSAGLDSASQQTKFSNRQLTSKLAVRSGESIVMGGLIRDRNEDSDSGIPLLKDIPIIGKAFSSTVRKTARTELLLVMTPRVVRTDVDVREVSEELRDRLRGLNDDDLLIRANNAPAPASRVVPVQPVQTQ
ncbi:MULTISPECIES: type II secretion system secretin GspD [unclassified Comamonas]|uniref:type II secretion system secretin GspD n=1 Tax=unclassified Comamonas TaxID=2638500 RepID=UPI001EFBADBE|nr:type II secretion system secretin GspD [Comamonas sp. B21-038]ULR89288.1 type II secretion system secretin GspD [Comamonas sp. B21-038]